MRRASILLLGFVLLASCKSVPDTEVSRERVLKDIIVYYDGGHFAPSRYSADARVISFHPGGQYSPRSYVGKSSPVLLRNLHEPLKHLEAGSMSHITSVAEAIRTVPTQHYLLVLAYKDGELLSTTISHSATVRRDGVIGKQEWFGKFLRSFRTLATYLAEDPAKSPNKGMNADK